MAAAQVRAFGLTPRVALISHANFGAHSSPGAARMRRATEILTETAADFEFEGEMQLNLAFDKVARDRFLPDARLTDRANILVFPGMDAANAAINALTTLGNAQPIGPVLLGYNGAAHIVTRSVTVRGLLNVAAIASAGQGLKCQIVREYPAAQAFKILSQPALVPQAKAGSAQGPCVEGSVQARNCPVTLSRTRNSRSNRPDCRRECRSPGRNAPPT